MFIHAGNRIIISDKKIVGIFNIETLKLSEDNKKLLENIGPEDRTIFLDRDNNHFAGNVRSYTVIKRAGLDFDFIWRKEND
ncbi:MAG: hypothetical protein MUC95_10145 [Spirochaetes bacterium]|nr:hypothetical protein [Spirochaetota bacterium]